MYSGKLLLLHRSPIIY